MIMKDYEEVPLKASDMEARLADLCALRDKVNAANAPLETRLEQANALSERYRLEAVELANQIDDTRCREKWIALKREIGVLTKATSGRR